MKIHPADELPPAPAPHSSASRSEWRAASAYRPSTPASSPYLPDRKIWGLAIQHFAARGGRILADVRLPDGTHVNHTLVKNGWWWWYRKYAPSNTELEKLEKEAREGKRGLWVDPSPVPPWVYRKARREQSLDLSDLVPLDAETEGNVATRGPPLLGSGESNSAPATATSPYPVIGNRKSHIYHRPECPNYSQVAPKNRVAFNSAAEAEAAGYRVAGNCP